MSARRPKSAGREAVLAELTARERDSNSGARPLVPIGEQESLDRLAALDALGARAFVLERRGVWHGEWAELEPERLGAGPWSRAPTEAARVARWSAARPIVLPGVLAPRLAEFASEIAFARELHGRLAEPGALRAFVKKRLAGLDERFTVLARRAQLFGAERDVERAAEALGKGRPA